MSQPDEPLPGLEPASAAASDLEKAVRRTLRALDESDLVSEVDAGRVQLAIELAQVISVKRSTGRASTVGNDARVLMEILDAFKAEASEVDESLAEAMRQWGEVVTGAGHATPEVRDGA